jgi:methanogenic corrinoid protein MtbC1
MMKRLLLILQLVLCGTVVFAGNAIKQIENNTYLCLSALLTTTMEQMKVVIEAITIAGLRNNVKIMVGGAPVGTAFAKEIETDGYSNNANTAVNKAKELLGIVC